MLTLTMVLSLEDLIDGSQNVRAVLCGEHEDVARGWFLVRHHDSAPMTTVSVAIEGAIAMAIGRALLLGVDPEALRRIAMMPTEEDVSTGRTLLEAPARKMIWTTKAKPGQVSHLIQGRLIPAADLPDYE